MADISIRRGDTSTLKVVIYQGSSMATVADLTGGKVYFTVKRLETDEDSKAVLAKTSEADGGIVISEPLSGEALVAISATESQGLLTGSHWYDIQFKDSSGRIFTPLAGRLIVVADLTVGVG